MKPRKPQFAPARRGKPAHIKPSLAHAETTQLVQIVKPIYGGAFLARMEGKAVFVPLTLPGEQVRVHIRESKRGYDTADPDEIVTAAPERVVPACPHFGACGGCHYQHAGYETQLAFKQSILRETLERGGVQAPEKLAVIAGDPWHYRNRIRLAFDSAGNPGYRGRQSHNIIPIRECPIAAPLLLLAANASAEIMRTHNSEWGSTEISLFCNSDESALLASAYTPNAEEGRFVKWARALEERIPALIGAELIQHAADGKQMRTAGGWGSPGLSYAASGFDYRVDRGAFFQINRWLVDSLVDCVTDGHKGKLAWDLFAGVGLFARKLAGSFERVVAVESSSASKAALKHNLQGSTGEAVIGETLPFLRRLRPMEKPDLVVVDPPRTGLGPEIATLLGEVGAPAIVYVSCDPATLARDVRALLGCGYAIESITLVDLFPQTFHLETVVRLRRG